MLNPRKPGRVNPVIEDYVQQFKILRVPCNDGVLRLSDLPIAADNVEPDAQVTFWGACLMRDHNGDMYRWYMQKFSDQTLDLGSIGGAAEPIEIGLNLKSAGVLVRKRFYGILLDVTATEAMFLVWRRSGQNSALDTLEMAQAANDDALYRGLMAKANSSWDVSNA